MDNNLDLISQATMSGLTMARPNQLPTRPEMTKEQIDSATYAGSPEHKVTEWWGGLPQAWEGKKGKANRPKKEKTSICRKVTAEERDEATEWVREALRKDQFRYYEGDKTFPKHLWYQDETGQFWFGFAINQIAGTYKGWPIDEGEKRATFD